MRERLGYPRRRLIWIYVLRNSVIAAVTQIGLLFGALIAGAVVVESIFDWPGIGNYAVLAILTADNKVTLVSIRSVGQQTEQAFLDLVEKEESRGFARAWQTEEAA